MSKSLSILQTIAKVAKIVCKVIFILCVIGAVGCLVGLFALLLLGTATFAEGDFLSELTGVNTFFTGTFGCIVGIIVCAGEAILARLGERYFSHVLEAGTPFTQDGSKEIFRLGITTIIVSVAVSVISAIVMGIYMIFAPELYETDFSMSVSVGTGLFCLFLSVLFQHGAELGEKVASLQTENEALRSEQEERPEQSEQKEEAEQSTEA